MNQSLPSQDWPAVAERLEALADNIDSNDFRQNILHTDGDAIRTALAKIASLTARAEAAERERDGMREALISALAVVDKATADCPVRGSPKNPDRCPKCRATYRDNCALEITAYGQLEMAMRAIFSTPTPSEPDNGE